jgi:hypothetical protein
MNPFEITVIVILVINAFLGILIVSILADITSMIKNKLFPKEIMEQHILFPSQLFGNNKEE